MTRLLVLILILVGAAGCDRAAVEPLRPSLVVESPDLGEILPGSELTLRVRAGGSGQIAAVEIGGEPAERSGDAYTATLRVSRGLTAIPLAAFDASGSQIVADTAYALFADPVTVQRAAPEGLDGGGALTVTALSPDRLLLAGGEPPAGDPRAPATLLRASGELLFVEAVTELGVARYNHTATLMPDGTVLLLGGATRRRPRSRGEFVTTAEQVTPGLAASVDVQVVGELPLRSGHVTRRVDVDGEVLLFLIGGVVPGEPPVPSRTLDVLRYVPSSVPRLVVLTPPGGSGELPKLPAPLLLDLTSSPDGRAASVLLGLGPGADVATRLSWAPPGPPAFPVGVSMTEAAPLIEGRTEAASAALPEGLFLVAGGRDGAGATLGSVEAVVPAAGRAFALPPAGALGLPRSGHGATSLGPGRMIVIGGYSEAGFPLLAPEITTL